MQNTTKRNTFLNYLLKYIFLKLEYLMTCIKLSTVGQEVCISECTNNGLSMNSQLD